MPTADRWMQVFRLPPAHEAVQPGRAPTFSIVIAAYQASAMIGGALESALGQSEPPHEIIVCDDGSTDDLEGAIRPYGDRVRYLRKERGGPASARNVGARAASGDFVAILDADDAYLPQRLEALGALAMARPDLDILVTDAYLELDGHILGRFTSETPFATDEQRVAILDRCFCAWPALRRSRLLADGGFDESLPTGSDWEVVIRLIFAGSRAGLVNEPLYRYRVRADSVTGDRVSTLRQRLHMLERVRGGLELAPAEEASLARSLDRQRRALLLTEAEAALRSGHPDARRRAFAVAAAGDVKAPARLKALASAFSPRLARWALERRARQGRSRLDRSRPLGE
jgi:hypothetical protein